MAPGDSSLLNRELWIFNLEPLQTKFLASKHSSTEPQSSTQQMRLLAAQELESIHVFIYILNHSSSRDLLGVTGVLGSEDV